MWKRKVALPFTTILRACKTKLKDKQISVFIENRCATILRNEFT
jgi:hypothetical protein